MSKELRRKIFPPAVVIAVGLLWLACAKQETESAKVMEQQTLDRWVAAHVSGATKHSNGMYTVVREAAPESGTAKPVEGNWVRINYTGYSMPNPPLAPDGNLFVTRDAALAAPQLASNTYTTHYAPHKVYMSLYTGQLTEAMYQTLLMMNQGATYRYYAPSALTYGAYGSSYSYGYQGQYALGVSLPSYMDIQLVQVITDVQKDERDSTAAYAWRNLQLEETDSLKYYLYLKQLPGKDTDDDGNPIPKQMVIPADSTASIYYVGRFFDGFVFDTNIDSIAKRVWNDNTTHSAYSYKPSDGKLIQAFYEAIITGKMRYNSWGKMAFSSDWGYGYAGDTPPSTTGTVIDSYEPLYFEFYIAPKDAEEEDEESGD